MNLSPFCPSPRMPTTTILNMTFAETEVNTGCCVLHTRDQLCVGEVVEGSLEKMESPQNGIRRDAKGCPRHKRLCVPVPREPRPKRTSVRTEGHTGPGAKLGLHQKDTCITQQCHANENLPISCHCVGRERVKQALSLPSQFD